MGGVRRAKYSRELHDAIEVQKEACAEILRSKDELIKEFRQELKKKDEEYVKALKQQQKEDINQLLERMRQEFKELQGEYEVELEAIEDAFLAERDELLNKNREEIGALYEKKKGGGAQVPREPTSAGGEAQTRNRGHAR